MIEIVKQNPIIDSLTLVSEIEKVRNLCLGELNGEDNAAPEFFYHYTDLNAGLSIIEKSRLRLTDIRFSNDPDEVMSGLTILNNSFYELFPDMRSLHPIHAGLFARIIHDINFTLSFDDDNEDLTKLRSMIEDSGLQMKDYTFPKSSLYVACFSVKADDLRQWMPYAANAEGVSLGFRNVGDVKNFINRPEFFFVEVCYEKKDRKQEYAKKLLKGFWPIVVNTDKNILVNLLGEIMIRLVIDIVANKSENYKDEGEWRICKMQSQTDLADVSFRIRDNIARPYIETEFSKETLEKVIVGPKSDFILNSHSLKLAAVKAGRLILPIPSNVKYRG